MRNIMRFKKLFTAVAVTLIYSAMGYSLEVVDFSTPSGAAQLYKKYEIKFNLDAQFNNPFDPDEIDIQAVFTDESGESVRIFGFYTQDYRVQVTPTPYTKRDGTEKIYNIREYFPISEPYWAIRFAPVKTGRYNYHLNIKTISGEFRYPIEDELSLECVLSQDNGFIRVDPKNPRYFRFDSGISYWGVGFNGVNTMGACDQGEVRSFDVMMKEEKYGANLMQINLCQGNYIEWTKIQKRQFPYYNYYEGLGRYNLQTASQIDSAINLAESLGIYLRFTFHHSADFEPDFFSAENTPGFQENPYSIENGGNCRKPIEFFTDSESWEYQRQHFRYAIARWGYSPQILCWILWGEVDNIRDYSPKIVGAWLDKAIAELRDLDSYNHIITSSWIILENGLLVYEHLNFDAFDFHSYIGFHSDRAFDVWGDMLHYTKHISRFNIPIIPGEYGYVKMDGFGPAMGMKDDEEGIHIHDQLWASLMCGTAVCAMPWHWEIYLDKFNLYPKLQGIAEFVKGEDFGGYRYFGDDKVSLDCKSKTIKYVKVEFPTREEKQSGMRTKAYLVDKKVPEARALGLVSSDRALVWVKDSGSDFITNNPAPYLDDIVLTVKGMDDGGVKVEYWDTESGEIISTSEATVKNGKTTIKLPRFSGDIALKIYR